MTRRLPSVALGWDPGPSECGWALVEGLTAGVGGQAKLLACGNVSIADLRKPFAELAAYRANAETAGAVVAIEVPAQLHPGADADVAQLLARSKQLQATARIAGMISQQATHLALPRFELPATRVRQAFCGKGNAKDARIKTMCQLYVAELGRTNAHERDAIAVATVALWNPRAWT